MKRYTKYKDTGVEWIGEIPSDWMLRKIKHNTYVKGRIGWQGLKTDEYLQEGFAYLVTGTDFSNGVINWKSCFYVDQIRYSEDHHIQLKEGDLLITKDGTIGKIALVKGMDKPSTLNSGIFLVRPLNSNYSTTFLYWVLFSPVFTGFFDYHKSGSTISHLYQNVFVEFVFPVPEMKIQSQICTFLDHKTHQIDDLILKKQKLIDLLKEEHTALINQAITKGLDTNVPMKDSGIDWLGEIPDNWEQQKLKFIAECYTSNVDKHSKDDEKIVSLCNYTDVYKNDLIQSGMNFMSATASLNEIENFTLKEDDVLITKDSETPDDIAIPAYVTENLFNVICGYHLAMIRSNKELLYGKYLFYLFKSYKFNQQFTIAANGITRFGLGISPIRNSVISIPSKSEQLKIVEFLDQKFKIVEKSVVQIEKEITLLHEYKTSLINEAVTGKINVSDAH